MVRPAKAAAANGYDNFRFLERDDIMDTARICNPRVLKHETTDYNSR
jgi:hypothetical protein